MKLLLATANEHKVRELAELLSAVPHLRLLSLRDFPAVQMPEETGATMRDNARLKAQHCARQSDLPALADDSGLEVDALDGAPGVISARWVAGSDADRTNALLAALQSTPPAQRTARYRCAICLAQPDGSIQEVEALCEGRIAREWRGANGFGYDPIFEITDATGAPPEYCGQTLAEAPPAVKALISHRARAVRLIAARLAS
jgi:XTP/dITP diphosphohydrolase